MTSKRNEDGTFRKGNTSFMKDKHHSEETKRKMRKSAGQRDNSNMGHPCSEKTKRKISEANKGKMPSTAGHHLSEETKLKISKANKGKYHDGSWVSPNKGRHPSDETRRKLSVSHTGKTGVNSSHWKGGITKQNALDRGSEKATQWRISVFKRDNYTCQRCGKTNCYIEAHHLVPWASAYGKDLRYSLGNGWTLCEDCHDYMHSNELDDYDMECYPPFLKAV